MAEPSAKDINAPSNDAISRQVAIDVLEKGLSKIPYMNNTDEEMIRRDERIGCIQEVRTLPSVQPRKGKWLNRRLVYMDVHIATCGQCGKRVVVGNFCPDCGSYNGGTSDDR